MTSTVHSEAEICIDVLASGFLLNCLWYQATFLFFKFWRSIIEVLFLSCLWAFYFLHLTVFFNILSSLLSSSFLIVWILYFSSFIVCIWLMLSSQILNLIMNVIRDTAQTPKSINIWCLLFCPFDYSKWKGKKEKSGATLKFYSLISQNLNTEESSIGFEIKYRTLFCRNF